MVKESTIFRRSECVNELRGNRIIINWRAAFFAKLCDEFFVLRINSQRCLELDISQRFHIG